MTDKEILYKALRALKSYSSPCGNYSDWNDLKTWVTNKCFAEYEDYEDWCAGCMNNAVAGLIAKHLGVEARDFEAEALKLSKWV